MKKDAFKEELSYLNIVKPQLELNIEYNENELKEIPKRYTNVEHGDQFLVESLMSTTSTKLRLLKLSKGTPYFARIDFVAEDTKKKSKLYIGKTTINSNNRNLTIDWRAPICSLYYDSDVGKVSYVSPIGVIKGQLELKRQIIIKNGELSDVLDTNLVTSDELLQPYLSVNADNKMKTIIASIQKEQNQIIRESIDKSIIVQGVAGSGKTSVALHRIAYLIYSLGEKVKSNQFLIIGPNRYFLNYITSVLPELETDPVEQETYLDVVNILLKENFSLDNQENKQTEKMAKTKYNDYQSFKSSLKYKMALDKFIDEYINGEIACDSFIIDNEEIYNKKKIRALLFNNKNKKINFNNACNTLILDFKNNINEIYSKMNEKYRKIYIALPPEDIARKESIKKSEDLEKMIKEKGIKLIKEYFKNFQVNTFDLYKLFTENIEKYVTDFKSEDLILFKEYSLSSLKKKKVFFEDLPALLHINTIVFGNAIAYKHIVIDEAQDYGLFHFDAIREAFSDSTFSIYGDLAQAIYSYRSINNWEDVVNSVFNQNCQILYLSKSYRTTVQITNNSNHILRKMHLHEAIPVIRHGKEVRFLNYANNLNFKINMINHLLNKRYKTIAFICKTDIESDKLYKELLKNNIDVVQINSNTNEYNGGIVVLTSSLSKGLEFDAVIINDASEDIYISNSLADLHLLYVSCTRSLHELIILYSITLSKAFTDIKQIN